METRLVDHFAAEFKQKVGIDVFKYPKGMAKLKKQVKRTKEILSANSEASITVESLVDEHDFRYVLSSLKHAHCETDMSVEMVINSSIVRALFPLLVRN